MRSGHTPKAGGPAWIRPAGAPTAGGFWMSSAEFRSKLPRRASPRGHFPRMRPLQNLQKNLKAYPRETLQNNSLQFPIFQGLRTFPELFCIALSRIHSCFLHGFKTHTHTSLSPSHHHQGPLGLNSQISQEGGNSALATGLFLVEVTLLFRGF